MDEIGERVAAGPVAFRILVQLAEPRDEVNDATKQWPEDRPTIAFGEVALEALVPGNAETQRRIIFDPRPRVDGIEAGGQRAPERLKYHHPSSG